MSLLDFFTARRRLEAHRQRLYRMAYAWCADPALADDLVQECLERALRAMHTLRDPDRFDPWIYSILNNCWREHLRRRRLFEELDEEAILDDACPETASYQQQIVDRVRSAVAALPLGQRQVITLIDLEGFSYAQVAEALSLPIGTVMSRLSRARAALQQHLADLGDRKATPVALRRVK